MKTFVPPKDEQYIRSRVGTMTALAGATRYTLDEGQGAGTSPPLGYEQAAAQGLLEVLPPFSPKTVELEIGVLEDHEAVDAFERQMSMGDAQ